MMVEILQHLARANLAVGAATVIAALLRRPVRSVFGASAAYGLWGILPVMALASFTPLSAGGPMVPVDIGAGLSSATSFDPGSFWPAVIFAAWGLGGLLLGALFLARQLWFAALVRGGVRIALHGASVVRSARTDIGPAAVWRTIVVPVDFEARFTPAEQAAIIAHEAQHLARGDVAVNALAALMQCLCWFNPLVHLAAYWIRLDQEFACDAAVISMRPGWRRPYAEALLKTQVVAAAPPAGCAWRARGFSRLRDRIRLLQQRAPSRPRRTCAALLLAALSLGGGYTAWAARLSQGLAIADPDWSRRPSAADLARLYPQRALAGELEGMAVMRCHVGHSGGLAACSIVRETPLAAGFGRAALQLAPLFQMKPLSMSGQSVAGRSVSLSIKFKLARRDAGEP